MFPRGAVSLVAVSLAPWRWRPEGLLGSDSSPPGQTPIGGSSDGTGDLPTVECADPNALKVLYLHWGSQLKYRGDEYEEQLQYASGILNYLELHDMACDVSCPSTPCLAMACLYLERTLVRHYAPTGIHALLSGQVSFSAPPHLPLVLSVCASTGASHLVPSTASEQVSLHCRLPDPPDRFGRWLLTRWPPSTAALQLSWRLLSRPADAPRPSAE